MESIVTKLKEYLAMDSEIEFSEFQDYYNKVLEKLNQDYQELTEDELDVYKRQTLPIMFLMLQR